MSDNHSRVTEFKSKLDTLQNKPQTTLQILNEDQRQKCWQRLLFHFLSPHEKHGLEYSLLEQLLNALSKRDDIKETVAGEVIDITSKDNCANVPINCLADDISPHRSR